MPQDHFSPADEVFMRRALMLAEGMLGATAPNPAVGCVIVKKGAVIGEGATAAGGRPHAESIALQQAGTAAHGATAYVTLEPCAHHGHTPPCVHALVTAGVQRVVIAAADPDPRVNGQGAALLRAAGIVVDEDLLAREAVHINRGFFTRIRHRRPWVTAKMAVSQDGYIAGIGGAPVSLTEEAAHRHAHGLRKTHDAILVGVTTVLNDNPRLTCRLPDVAADSPFQPMPVILDSHNRLRQQHPTAHIFSHPRSRSPLIVSHDLFDRADRTGSNRDATYDRTDRHQGMSAAHGDSHTATGVESKAAGGAAGDVRAGAERRGGERAAGSATTEKLDPAAVLGWLASAQGINSVLLEGGAKVFHSFLAAEQIDEIHWIVSPRRIGQGGVWALPLLASSARAAEYFADFGFSRLEHLPLGADMLWLFRRG